MPTNKSVTIPAAVGFNNTDDSKRTAPNVAQGLVNVLCDYAGEMRAAVTPAPSGTFTTVASAPNTDPILGMLYYRGCQQIEYTDLYGTAQTSIYSNPGADFLLTSIAGATYTCQYQKGGYVAGVSAVVPFAPSYPYMFTPPTVIGDGVPLNPPGRIRGVQFGNELVICQGGNAVNTRFYSLCTGYDPFSSSTHMRILGLPTPPITGSSFTAALHSPSGGHVARTGQPSYAVALIDEFGRLSSPSEAITLNFVANPSDNALLTFTWFNSLNGVYAAQVAFIEYVTGNPVGYIINTQFLLEGANTITYEDGPTGTTDLTIEQGVVGPTPGENNPPDSASLCAQYLDRILLNSVWNPDTLQISNAGSPTQFNLLGYNPVNPNPADGVRLPINSDTGDPITGIAVFGTFCVIAKTKGLYFLYGQDCSNFQVQQIAGCPGCVAPDSWVIVDGYIYYLATDGLRAFDGATSTKVSQQIDASLEMYDPVTYSEAQAVYVNRRYILNIGVDIWVFDFDADGGNGAWTYFAFGVNVLQYIFAYYGQNYYPGQVNPSNTGGNSPTTELAEAGSGGLISGPTGSTPGSSTPPLGPGAPGGGPSGGTSPAVGPIPSPGTGGMVPPI